MTANSMHILDLLSWVIFGSLKLLHPFTGVVVSFGIDANKEIHTTSNHAPLPSRCLKTRMVLLCELV